MSVAALTLVRGRAHQLANLLEGLALQNRPPDEIVVAAMGPVPPVLACERARVVEVPGDALPLAAARNAAARASSADHLVFLDVDCVPSSALIARYDAVLAHRDACLMGEVRYLPYVPTSPLDLDALERDGVRHPAKTAPPADIAPEPDHGALWGLSFALRRSAFDRAGGFDERYVGYGSEETDFAMRLKAAGVPLLRVGGACAFHQAHPVHIPPLQHFDAIVRNASLFHATWGRWSMDYWLGQLSARGYIEWSPSAAAIRVMHRPTDDEIAASRAPEGTLFS